jgi:hypothetical protein
MGGIINYFRAGKIADIASAALYLTAAGSYVKYSPPSIAYPLLSILSIIFSRFLILSLLTNMTSVGTHWWWMEEHGCKPLLL